MMSDAAAGAEICDGIAVAPSSSTWSVASLARMLIAVRQRH